MKSKLTSFLSALFGALLMLGFAQVLAWTSPPASPPTNNVPAPINVGNSTQTKSGGGIVITGGGLKTDVLQLINSGEASGKLLVSDANGVASWKTTLEQDCVVTDTASAFTGQWIPVSIVKDGRNLCTDDEGCTYRLLKYNSANPEGLNMYGKNAYYIRQNAVTGAWYDSNNDQQGINGDSVRKDFGSFSSGDFTFTDDSVDITVENSKDFFSIRDNTSTAVVKVWICDF